MSRKLIVVVGIFILAASGLTILTNFSLNVIAATGDYSDLLSQWNRYHYQSAMHVERLAISGEPKHFKAYQEIQAHKDSIQLALDEFFAEDPDVASIFQTFDSERVRLNEISGLITVFHYLKSSERVRELNRQWQKLKEVRKRQNKLVVQWYENHKDKELSESTSQTILQQFNKLNEEWTKHSKALMLSVGNTSGLIKRFGLWISVMLGILLVLIGVVVTVRANKSIVRWEEALYEKDILLAEIHHRVKNNLAVISGMLELESMNEGNADRALRKSRDRIKSMAMIHEKLYQSGSFSNVDLAVYLDDLSKYICNTYIGSQKDITLEADFAPVQLNINQAVPVGLVINEIMANLIEYGFEEEKPGTVKMAVHQIEEKVLIQIKGEGHGLSEDINFTSLDSTGSAIVDALIEQINGELTVEKNGEVNVKIVFQKSDAAGSSNALS